jgi:hypothetical protein
MARDAYRNNEAATRARLAQLEIELENSQKRIAAIRLEIAATELRYPAKSTETRQAVAILLLGVDFYLFVKVRLDLTAMLFLLIIASGLVLMALPTDFAKAIKRRADRGRLEEAERTRDAIAQRVSEAKATLGPMRVANETDSDAGEHDVVLRKKI